MASITSANAVLLITIPALFPAPQQIQGFAADDVFDVDALESAETMMGVDGNLSGGFVYNAVKQNYSLMADSPSNDFFDAWWAAQQVIKDVYSASGSTTLISVGKKYAMTKGFLTSYKPIADGKKVLQPRKFTITWQSISPANTQ